MQIHTKGTRQRTLQHQKPAEPPELFDADEHRRRRAQTSCRLGKGGPPTLKKTAKSTRRERRDLDVEQTRPSRPHAQHQHHPPPGRPGRARTTTTAPPNPAPESSTKPLRSGTPAPSDSTPRLHGRPEKPPGNGAPESSPLASTPPQLHPPPPRPAREIGRASCRERVCLYV